MNASAHLSPRRRGAACLLVVLCVLSPATAAPTPHTTFALAASFVAASATATLPRVALEARDVSAQPAEPVTVHLVLTRGRQRLELDLPVDGNVTKETAAEIAELMRDPASGRMRRIARGTLVLLADVAARFPGHEIEIISAVRAEPERTRAGIKHSKHWDGHAIDLRVHDVKLSQVRDQIWANHRDVGVGWYPQQGFIHLDYRPDVHDMAWTQPRPNADNIYHPRWSRRARETPAVAPSPVAWFDSVAKLVADTVAGADRFFVMVGTAPLAARPVM